MDLNKAAVVLEEHMLVRRGESTVHVCEWELTEAVRMAVVVLRAEHLDAQIMAATRADLMESRK